EAEAPPGGCRLAIDAALEGLEVWEPGRGHVHELATLVLAEGAPSDSHRCRFGVREIRMRLEPDDQFRLHVNGRRHYVRAVNHIPGVFAPELDEARCRRDLELVAAANLNSVGLHAHVLPQRFYDVADEAGVLVYQDFPLNLAHDPAGAPLF